jgi:hypothetical protein
MDSFVALYTLGFPAFFVGLWLTITTLLRKMAGMTTGPEAATGDLLRSSAWGSASINGVSARRCVKIEEYPDGFMLRMMWIFGDGRLWLPKHDLQVGDERPGGLIIPRSRVLVSGQHRVVLRDRLADFV